MKERDIDFDLKDVALDHKKQRRDQKQSPTIKKVKMSALSSGNDKF